MVARCDDEKCWHMVVAKGGSNGWWHELVVIGGGVRWLTLKKSSTAAFLMSVVRMLSRMTSLSAIACVWGWYFWLYLGVRASGEVVDDVCC